MVWPTSKLLAGIDGGNDDRHILMRDIRGILREGDGAVGGSCEAADAEP